MPAFACGATRPASTARQGICCRTAKRWQRIPAFAVPICRAYVARALTGRSTGPQRLALLAVCGIVSVIGRSPGLLCPVNSALGIKRRRLLRRPRSAVAGAARADATMFSAPRGRGRRSLPPGASCSSLTCLRGAFGSTSRLTAPASCSCVPRPGVVTSSRLPIRVSSGAMGLTVAFSGRHRLRRVVIPHPRAIAFPGALRARSPAFTRLPGSATCPRSAARRCSAVLHRIRVPCAVVPQHGSQARARNSIDSVRALTCAASGTASGLVPVVHAVTLGSGSGSHHARCRFALRAQQAGQRS